VDGLAGQIVNLFEVVLFWQVMIFGIPFLIDWAWLRRR